MELPIAEIEKILVAAILGGLIGLERQWSGKSAGFRTVMLVCVGAALFTIMSYRMPGTTSTDRIASNIVVGIGFLGAGIIFRGNRDVHGLTTAATVWAAAAVGMASGSGYYALAFGTTVIILIVLMALHYLEHYAERKWMTRRYRIKYTYEEGDPLLNYDSFFDKETFTLLKSKTEKHNNIAITTWVIRASEKEHNTVVDKMMKHLRIREIDF